VSGVSRPEAIRQRFAIAAFGDGQMYFVVGQSVIGIPDIIGRSASELAPIRDAVVETENPSEVVHRVFYDLRLRSDEAAV